MYPCALLQPRVASGMFSHIISSSSRVVSDSHDKRCANIFFWVDSPIHYKTETRQMRGRRSSIKGGGLCIPRLRSNRTSPVSLLERFREVVFRLIMLSAISKTQQTGSACGSSRSPAYPPDSFYCEAVADCIEFIKKSACEEDGRESSSAALLVM